MESKRPVRIGNAQAFWGDRGDAAAETLRLEPDLDFLTLDYLAEVSMSILARQREQDSGAGYARDFVEVVRSLVPYWKQGGRCRVITNAGGLNSRGCAEECARVLAEAGCRRMRLAIVTGDDVLTYLLAASDDSFHNLDSGAPITEVRDRLVTANAYLGATSIVEALNQGAEIVITGRVADPSLTVAPCIHHFGWAPTDWNRIAGATVAGHLIECGTQVTGGISTDWLDEPAPDRIGFPIAEVSANGDVVITKPRDTGGQVDEWTVKEQLLYEVGDPGRYLSPDATVSFLSLDVQEITVDRVRVTGAVGAPPPETYKVSATYRDGFRADGLLTIFGYDAVEKARRCGEVVLKRLANAGCEFSDSIVECLGSGDCVPGVLRNHEAERLREVVLRIAVQSPHRESVERFTLELAPLITAGPQGTTGYAAGRPRVHPVFRYWPCLIGRDEVRPCVEILESPGEAAKSSAQRHDEYDDSRSGREQAKGVPTAKSPSPSTSGTLRDLARARSGDKGIHANIGVIARSPKAYDYLVSHLTADRVVEYFQPMGMEAVERFELANLRSLNFVVRGILASSLRTDAQGKTLGQALLEMPLENLA